VHASGGSWQYKAVIAARLAGIPSVWHINDTFVPRWLKIVFRFVQPLPSGFIFASHRSREYYGVRLAGRPQAVIPSVVDLACFDPSRSYVGEEALLAELEGGLLLEPSLTLVGLRG